ncbi:MAG: hypothetical protein GX851_08310 [Clostridiales bacterium]|nr:hypothetical protein [Clostridiales bacterium]
MSITTITPGSVVSFFENIPALGDIDFVTEYPNNNLPYPLTSPTAAIGTESISVTEIPVSVIENQDGTQTTITGSRTLSVKIRLGIHVPRTQSGEVCHTVYKRLLDALLSSQSFTVHTSGCSRTHFVRNTGSLYLSAWFIVNSNIV